jgi:transglutaminase-like putative cysteine protease
LSTGLPEGLALELLVERQQDVVEHEEPVLRVRRDPADVVGRKAQVQRVHHPARRRDAEVALQVRVVVPAQRRHPVALLQPRGQQRRRELARAPVEVREALPLERLVR